MISTRSSLENEKQELWVAYLYPPPKLQIFLPCRFPCINRTAIILHILDTIFSLRYIWSRLISSSRGTSGFWLLFLLLFCNLEFHMTQTCVLAAVFSLTASPMVSSCSLVFGFSFTFQTFFFLCFGLIYFHVIPSSKVLHVEHLAGLHSYSTLCSFQHSITNLNMQGLR